MYSILSLKNTAVTIIPSEGRWLVAARNRKTSPHYALLASLVVLPPLRLRLGLLWKIVVRLSLDDCSEPKVGTVIWQKFLCGLLM